MNFSESALYRHFKSKDEIILTMLNYIAENFQKKFAKCLSDKTDPETQLRELFKNQLEFFSAHPHFLIPVISDGLFDENKLINEALLKIMDNTRKIFTGLIKKGQKEKVFRNDIQAEDLTHMIMGSFRLLMFQWRTAEFKFDIKQKGSGMISALFQILK